MFHTFLFVMFLLNKTELGKRATMGYLGCMAIMLMGWDGLQPPSAAVVVIGFCFLKGGIDELTYALGKTKQRLGKELVMITSRRLNLNRRIMLVLLVVVSFVVVLEY